MEYCELQGMTDLLAKMQALPNNLEKKHVNKALRAGAKIIQAQAVSDSPVRTGLTQGAIKVRAGKRSRTGITMLVSIGRDLYQGDSFYAAFVNYGWKHGPRRLKDNRVHIEGKRWLQKAFQKTKNAAQALIVDTIWKLIEREATNGTSNRTL